MNPRCRSGLASACALATFALVSVAPAPAVAGDCSNEQFRSGSAAGLPDCRAYERVSPAAKAGFDAVTFEPIQPVQSSACEPGTECTIAYITGVAFPGAPGNDVYNAYRASRAQSGWLTTPLMPSTPQAPASGIASVAYDFSEDLTQTVLRVPFQQLTPDAPADLYNLFLRRPDGTYALVTASAPLEPPPAGCPSCYETDDKPAFVGASADFSHVIFEANDRLVEEAPGEVEGEQVENLYESTGEHVRLVGILPDGRVAPDGAAAGGGLDVVNEHSRDLAHAISADGSRILFEADADGGIPDPSQEGATELYDRIDGDSTLEVSAPAAGARPSECETEGGSCAPKPAQFWTASADGSLVYFTSKASLTKASYTGPEPENAGNDLYRYDVETGTLGDLTADAHNPEDPDGADVLGVVGASQDGAYVYFVAEGHLAPGAPAGKLAPNLYVWHETSEGAGTTRYIATLAAPDGEEERNIEHESKGPAYYYHSDLADWTDRPTESQAYVTPDGRHLAFMSVQPLTGYDNDDQVTGEPDHEVFEYDAEAGQLVCASCDPNGERPIGSAFIGAELYERASSPFHQPRVLSDDGSRLFFSSPDPLVSGLAGGGSDKLFEYEEGSIGLIAGKGGADNAVFLDASPSGNDVFFATRERLLASDEDELVDVYDARVDGGLPEPPAATLCEDGACQGAPAPAPLLTAPVSELFTGAGNLAPPHTAAKPTRAQLLARALGQCRKLRSRVRRTACIRAARRRYAHTDERDGARASARNRRRPRS